MLKCRLCAPLFLQKVLLAIMCAISIQFGQLISPGADELYIAYLPLAHVSLCPLIKSASRCVRPRELIATAQTGAAPSMIFCVPRHFFTAPGLIMHAQILELVAEFFYFSYGLKVGYADPKSLLGGPERAYPTGALEEFQPTLMAGVPKV